jgi:4-diphosphocytidyl-2-C-methyl-D-erythritol kinase
MEAREILIHYGGLERPDKLVHCIQVARLAGHQNFSTVPPMPNWRDGKRKAATKVTADHRSEKNLMNSTTVKAPAKVNLFLKVLSRRSDGYHNIETLFERIAIFDTIKISKIPEGIIVKSDRPVTKNPKDNLVYRAAQSILRRSKVKSGVEIRIKKRIPIAAGLGGGSSDAAATIIGIDKLFKLNLTRANMMSIGKKIGADVPFFLLDTPFALGKGIGGNLNIVKSGAQLWHLLVFPGFRVSTKSVYKEFDSGKIAGSKRLTGKKSGVKMISSLTDYRAMEQLLYNDLERASISKKGIIGEIKNSLGRLLDKKFIVSGSGPSLFCLYSTGKEALAARRKVLSNMPSGVIGSREVFAVRTA